MKDIIIALGSNHNQTENIGRAERKLSDAFNGSVKFSKRLWTEPIGIESDKFLNSLASACTDMTESEATATLKRIERECGNTAELRRRGIIELDLDLLKYGDVKRHEADWRRSYIIELIRTL